MAIQKKKKASNFTIPTPYSLQQGFLRWLDRFNRRLTDRYQSFLNRRPHRTFRRSRRRDYVRSLVLPGYIAFTAQVTRMLMTRKKVFLPLIGMFALVIILIGAVVSQDTYSQIDSLLKELGGDVFGQGGMSKVGQAGLLMISTFAVNPNTLSVDQQIYMANAMLFAWLCTVWLLRECLAGRNPRLRDSLYNAGAPIISTTIVVMILIIQLLPIGLMALVYAALMSVGILESGFGSMLFWVFAAVVAALVLYWITSTLIGLVVVTLPGMYPLRALRAAGDLVVSRRLRILYRWLWAIAVIVVAWAVIMIPIILLESAAKSAWTTINDVPIVPCIGAVMTALSVVWFAAYVYLLYRRIVDDDAKPA